MMAGQTPVDIITQPFTTLGGASSMTVDAASLCADLQAVNDGFSSLCEGLTPEQLTERPAPARWSIAENLAHLWITTELYLPVVDRETLALRQSGAQAAGPFQLGWWGRLLVRYVEPPPLMRLPAPAQLRPLETGPAAQVLERFLASQAEMDARMASAAGLDLTVLRFPSPLASFIKMNLLEFFCVFNGHARRHLWQATGVRRDLGLG